MTRTLHQPTVCILATVLIAAMGFASCGPERSAAASREGEVVLATASIDPSAFLSADRATTWNPGTMGVGGPVRTFFSKLSPRGGELDDTAKVQAAINNCAAGQIVQLEADTFTINGGNFLLIDKGITLRGAGPGPTTLAKINGAKSFQPAVSANPSPLIIVGPSRYSTSPDASGVVGCTDLTADGAKGTYSATVASAAGFSPGQIVCWMRPPVPAGERTLRVAGKFGPHQTGGSSGRSTILSFATSTTSRPTGSQQRPAVGGLVGSNQTL
jgi:hypothetical protein